MHTEETTTIQEVIQNLRSIQANVLLASRQEDGAQGLQRIRAHTRSIVAFADRCHSSQDMAAIRRAAVEVGGEITMLLILWLPIVRSIWSAQLHNAALTRKTDILVRAVRAACGAECLPFPSGLVGAGTEIPESPSIREIMLAAHDYSSEHALWADPPVCRFFEVIQSLALANQQLSDTGSLRYNNGLPEGFGVSLAESVLTLCDIAQHLDVDLEELIRLVHHMRLQKMEPSQTEVESNVITWPGKRCS
jgi:hypothetical protein